MNRRGVERTRAMIATTTARLAEDDPVVIRAGSGHDETKRACDVGELRALLQPPSTAASHAPYWIVVALDRAGPCERGERPYSEHAAEQTARAEARRLGRMHGGRFAVMRAVCVVGWTETEFVAPKGAADAPDDDAFIPF